MTELRTAGCPDGSSMEQVTTSRRRLMRLRSSASQWQRAAVGLLALSAAANAALYGLLGRSQARCSQESDELRAQLRQAEAVRDQAVRELGALALSQARERQARAEQAEAFEAAGEWEYIGECTLTYYCPCEACCGRWADGVTASGLPAGPGIVAVDESVIPLGSTVIIDGQRYLAADTGVTGRHVDVCVTDHAAAEALGVGTAQVWVAAG